MLSQHGHDSPEPLYVTCYLLQDTSTPLPLPHPILSFIPIAVMDVLLTHSCSSSIQLRYSVCSAHRSSSPLLCPFLCVFLGLCSLSLFSGMSLFHLHSYRIIVSAPYGLSAAPPCPLVCPSQLAAHFAISLCLPGSLFSVFCLPFRLHGSQIIVCGAHRPSSAPLCPLVLRRSLSQLAVHFAISLCLPESLFLSLIAVRGVPPRALVTLGYCGQDYVEGLRASEREGEGRKKGRPNPSPRRFSFC